MLPEQEGSLSIDKLTLPGLAGTYACMCMLVGMEQQGWSTCAFHDSDSTRPFRL